MWTSERRYRIDLERQLLARELPQFVLQTDAQGTRVRGWQCTTKKDRYYELTLELPEHYPDEAPQLYVTSPMTLWKHRRRGTINAEGTSHAFHTRANGPGGCVRICHDETGWDASQTCVTVLMKGICWLEGYQAHLATGCDIADFMC